METYTTASENTDENILIRSAKAEDFERIKQLAELRFGIGYLDRQEFDAWLRDPDFFLVAEVDGRFAGYAYHRPESVEELASYMKLDPAYVRQVSGGRPVIHCRSAALAPEFEHRGLMQKIVAQLEETAGREGFGAEFAPAWKYGEAVPMRKNLLARGYTELCEREKLWYDQENYRCVICGGRCRCTAVIFQRIFPQNN